MEAKQSSITIEEVTDEEDAKQTPKDSAPVASDASQAIPQAAGPQPSSSARDAPDAESTRAPSPTAADAVSGDAQEDTFLESDEYIKDKAKSLAAKERGNQHFAKADYDNALDSYAEALLLAEDADVENRAVFHNNKAAAHFMLVRNLIR